MKHTWHKWMLAGLLITLMLATAVLPALAQESTASNTTQVPGLTLGLLLFGVGAVVALGFAAYMRDNHSEN
jgi:hypothetical protein